jgi:uncharacterized coiled-coil protein SlyX
MIGIPSDLKDMVAETRAGMAQINANLERVVELLEQLVEIQHDEMRRASSSACVEHYRPDDVERLDVSA